MLLRAGRILARAIPMLASFGFLEWPNGAAASELSLTEYQVKSLFLLNFSKYVDWPAAAFDAAAAPIVIGLLGETNLNEALQTAVAGKIIGGRRVVIQLVAADGEIGKCHILFVSTSETKRVGEILGKIKALPVLTVGEIDQFMDEGGAINFVKKEGKVRLEINLTAARLAGLEISSKLLSVADTVKGRRN